MDFTPLEQDADRALKELLPILRISDELSIAVVVRPEVTNEGDELLTDVLGGVTVNACMRAHLDSLHVNIQVSSRHVTTGESLWSAMVHEVAHIYQAELMHALVDIERASERVRPLIHAAMRGIETANLRVERLILRNFPCPPWLEGRTYDPPGGDA
ncbi:hypothetical protein DM785_02625 [Deinococcus actinosclerus]|nr:hypothetical protein DM785_02625 [Deinococcus actinosclerus]